MIVRRPGTYIVEANIIATTTDGQWVYMVGDEMEISRVLTIARKVRIEDYQFTLDVDWELPVRPKLKVISNDKINRS